MVKKIYNNHVLSCLQSKSVPLCKFIFSCFSLWRQRTAGCHLPNTVTIPHTLKTVIKSSSQPSLLRNSNFFLTQIIKKIATDLDMKIVIAKTFSVNPICFCKYSFSRKTRLPWSWAPAFWVYPSFNISSPVNLGSLLTSHRRFAALR